MTESRDGNHGEPVDREAILRDILTPQINRLIELDFHKSAANEAYMDALDEEIDYTSVLEARFRTQLQRDIVLPESIEDPSRLLLVVPTLQTSQKHCV